jgi:disulfide bond formation protein DsbB
MNAMEYFAHEGAHSSDAAFGIITAVWALLIVLILVLVVLALRAGRPAKNDTFNKPPRQVKEKSVR